MKFFSGLPVFVFFCCWFFCFFKRPYVLTLSSLVNFHWGSQSSWAISYCCRKKTFTVQSLGVCVKLFNGKSLFSNWVSFISFEQYYSFKKSVCFFFSRRSSVHSFVEQGFELRSKLSLLCTQCESLLYKYDWDVLSLFILWILIWVALGLCTKHLFLLSVPRFLFCFCFCKAQGD